MSDIKWSPSKDKAAPRLLIKDDGNPLAQISQFSSALKNSGIVDHLIANIPGCVVALPLGTRIFNNYRSILRKELTRLGFDEYEYPNVISMNHLSKTNEVFSLNDKILYTGNDEDWKNGDKRLALCPTGEAAIYSHWAKLIRSAGDLPLKTFQNGTYFRPLSAGKHSGGSVYKSLEAHDVFEMHSAFLRHEEAIDFFAILTEGLQTFVRSFPLAVIWGDRPLAFNHGQLSHRTIGCDAILPSGGTVQVSCLYDQGQIFSKAFDVGVKIDGIRTHTWQVTAALTRRLVYAVLQMGVRSDNRIFIHPSIAPVGFALAVQDCPEFKPRDEEFRRLVHIVGGKPGILKLWTPDMSYRQLQNWAQTSGAPLLAILRMKNGSPVLTMIRFDDFSEWDTSLSSAVDFPKHITEGIETIVCDFSEAVRSYVIRRSVSVSSMDEMAEALKSRHVAICHLAPTPENLSTVENFRQGEILSTQQGEQGRCIVSGLATDNLCAVSTRL